MNKKIHTNIEPNIWKPDRIICNSDSIIKVIMQGEIIKQYEDDKPFPSCLLLGMSTSFL